VHDLSSPDAQALIDVLQARNGSIQCREIVGEWEPERFEGICRPVVYDTSLMIEEHLAALDEASEADDDRRFD
jgi:hypothetical protein